MKCKRRRTILLAVTALLLELARSPVAAHDHHEHHEVQHQQQKPPVAQHFGEDYDDAANAAYIHESLADARNSSHYQAAEPMHHHHGLGMTSVNETEYNLRHGPIPPSYYSVDTGDPDYAQLVAKYGSHSGLMTAHALFMTLSFLIFLPILIVVRVAKHRFLSGLTLLLFLSSLALGVFTGAEYSASTHNLYAGQIHNKIGWITTLVAAGLSLVQIIRTFTFLFKLSEGLEAPTTFANRLKSLLSNAVVSYTPAGRGDYELVEQHQEHEVEPLRPSLTAVNAERSSRSLDRRDLGQWRQSRSRQPLTSAVRSLAESTEMPLQQSELPHMQRWASGSGDGQVSPAIFSSQDTLHEEPLYMLTEGRDRGASSPPFEHGIQVNPPRARGEPPRPFYDLPVSQTKGTSASKFTVRDGFAGFSKYSEALGWRISVLLGWSSALTGIVVYTGTCRAEADYRNACLAHYIKGSIFFWYGLLTFGRYLGSWAELGWAWNRRPSSTKGTWRERAPSAEMIECFVIFLYGASNTFMERIGAATGDPFTVHQLQHISIAVMFFFAGACGMMLESKAIRRWISQAVLQRVNEHAAPPPASYSGSFNIFPALVIGVTGLAMSSHAQDYEFSTTIHTLWGNLLALFAVCRFLTYTFLHLRPPASALPSRPPTEAMAAFFLTAGGIVFMLSSNEIVFWAVRHGFADSMTFFNATVAFICFVFMFVFALLGLKGWATQRPVQAVPHLDPEMQPRWQATQPGKAAP